MESFDLLCTKLRDESRSVNLVRVDEVLKTVDEDVELGEELGV